MTTSNDGGRGLEWTGERYVPEVQGNIRLEHVHRYLLARGLVNGRRVLDIACGEGYGSDLMAGVAAQVVGVDIVPEVLEHARRRYRRPHLRFAAGSCTAIPLASQCVDVVVSFETLEHHDQHDAMIREVKRVLTPGGLLIISSPDRREYSDIPGYTNPYHVRELYRDEFEALLTSHFRAVAFVGQRVRAGSVLSPVDQVSQTTFTSTSHQVQGGPSVDSPKAPLYLIGVATDGQLPPVPTGLLEGGDFVWTEDQTRAVRELLDQHRAEMDQLYHGRVAQEAAAGVLRAEIDRITALVTSLSAAKAQAEERAGWFQEEVERRGQRIAELEALLDGTRGELHVTRETGRTREAALETAVANLQIIRATLEARLTTIENSYSWRLTAPLRGARRRVTHTLSSHSHETAVDNGPETDLDRNPGDGSTLSETPTQIATTAEPPELAVIAQLSEPAAAGAITPGASTGLAQRPSIVVVSHDAHFYGAQRVALFLAQTLATEMGYDVDVLLCGDGPLRDQFAAAGRLHDFFSEASTPEVQARIIRDLYDKGARIALCNTSCVGNVVHLLKITGFRTVALIHELPGLIAQYGLEDSIATIARDADKVVFAAGVVRDRFVEQTGLSTEKIVVRPQGLLTRNRYNGRRAEARRELRALLGLREDMKIVLAVGSAHRRKGPDLFVQTGLAVREKRKDVAFVWVGHKDGDGFADAFQLVSSASAEPHFFFPGVIEDSDVFFAGADVYLMTSREDPFPSVVLHALDAELPVIGFDDAGGFVELLRRDCGILVPYLDTNAMADAVVQLLSDPATGRSLSTVGKDIVSREFGFVEYVRDLVLLAQGPRVSVIVPNYNYAHYLPSRLRSILAQTYRPYEIIFLDDCSTDRSVEVAEELLGRGGIPYRVLRNDRNQGVYRQWLRGLAEATGDLVWIAEADDDCSPLLLETLAPSFARPGVVLVYSQSRQVDDAGREIAPDYLGWTEDVDRTKWRDAYVRRGVEEIRDSLAVKNTIPNVSAVLMRKPNLAEIETDLLSLRNAGDWLVYVHLLERGDLAYVPASLNYHRRHGASVTIGHGGLNLMRETLLVQRRVLDRHQIPVDVNLKREAHLQATYEYLGLNTNGPASYKDHEALRPLAVVAK